MQDELSRAFDVVVDEMVKIVKDRAVEPQHRIHAAHLLMEMWRDRANLELMRRYRDRVEVGDFHANDQ